MPMGMVMPMDLPPTVLALVTYLSLSYSYVTGSAMPFNRGSLNMKSSDEADYHGLHMVY